MAACSAGIISIVLLAGTLGLVAFGWIGALACCGTALVLADLGFADGVRTVPISLAGVAFGLAVGLGVVLLALFVAPLRNELHFAIFPQDEGLLLAYPA